ncbi:cytochrome biogenesis protein [Pseudoalteromonas sp. NBT06-2]|uniref:sulfite exporter TauE/SafE family protein n=1 Tax=Pseudoalteromonas sp. NBT06-2 TaxID=2025950 RepID=UPI000BA6D5CC|nr:sulfite exporter TauE/SafE family protein [Pseudoalteromonas sp. NBT06-2]PAJ72825.1 cytochrome biogenesis protein [Pseudoalteromonas sp. NBT06-2]
MTVSLFLTAFFMGLAGSGHCIAMCGGIASSLQFAIEDKSKAQQYALLYNIGRLLSYSLCGALVGGISSIFAQQSNDFSLFLSFLSAIFMVLVGLYIMRLAASLNWLERFGKYAIWQHIFKLNKYLLPLNSKKKALAYGALWGWLPCGLVYSALTWAITTQSATSGSLFMASFAMGTLPAMIGLGFAAQTLKSWLNNSIIRIILGNILVFYGLYLLTIATKNALH